MRKWQHQETGRICETDAYLGPGWDLITYECEHGFKGCCMPGDHLPEECHDASMLPRELDESATVLQFTGTTTRDTDPQSVVDALQNTKFKRILVIGFDEDDELYVSSHTSDIGALLLLMERAKQHLLFDVETE